MSTSRILKEMHESATDLYTVGAITDTTLREFDALCLSPVHELKPTQIKKIRRKEKVSQAVLALYLNTSLSTIQKWEIGQKKPQGIALKMLNLIERKGLKILL